MAVVGSIAAQKTMLKGHPTPADSAEAAAARAELLMKAARDSLRTMPIAPPSAVVDSFAVAPATDPAFSFVSQEEFDAVRKRITQAERDLSTAAKALDRASQSGRYSDTVLEAAGERIRLQGEALQAVEARLDAMEQDWKTRYKTPRAASAPSPSSPSTKPAPAPPAQPATSNPKAGLGKPELQPSESPK